MYVLAKLDYMRYKRIELLSKGWKPLILTVVRIPQMRPRRFELLTPPVSGVCTTSMLRARCTMPVSNRPPHVHLSQCCPRSIRRGFYR